MNTKDKKAFLEAYQQTHESLMRFCIVKSQGIMDPKDLANDTLLVGLENFSKLKNKKAFLAYLFSTANNICLNQIRKKKHSNNYLATQTHNISNHHTSIENAIDISILYKALDQLPPLQKEAVTLFEISDLPIKDIMAIQNAGESAVKQRIKRGREKLAKLLQEKENKKIAVLSSVIIGSNTFGMEHLDHYFQTLKQQPLPLTNQEAISIIKNYQTPPSPPTGKIISKTLIKKGLIGGSIISGIILTSALATHQNNTPNNQKQPTITQAAIALNIKPNPPRTNTIFKPKKQNQNTITETSTLPIEKANFTTIEPIKFTPNFTTPNPNPTLTLKTSLPLTNPKKTIPPLNNTTSAPPFQNSDTAISKGEIFNLDGIDEIKLEHLGENITIKTWSNNTMKIEAEYQVEAKKAEDKATVLKNTSYTTTTENEQLIIRQKVKVCNSKSTSLGSNLSKTTVKYENGDKAKYNKLKRTYTITIPKHINLSIKENYANIVIPELDGKLKASVYNSNLKSLDINNDVALNIKYSNITIGNFKNGDIKLYSSTLHFKNANHLDFNSKYSKAFGQTINSMEASIYEGKTELSQITSSIKGSLKYTSLKSEENTESAHLKLYESKLKIANINTLKASIKYSSIEANTINKLSLTEAYSSKINIEKTNHLEAISSKYNNYTINTVTSEISMNSYSDKITVSEIYEQFKTLKFSGKYTSYNLNLMGNPTYEIDLKNQYGKLNYDRSILHNKSFEKIGSTTLLTGMTDQDSTTKSKIKFSCFECNITLN